MDDKLNILIHEIKNPITIIKGFTSLLNSEDLSKKDIKEYTGIIDFECNYLTYILNNLDILSLLINNKTDDIIINKEEINLKDILDEIIYIYKVKAKHINFTSDFTSNIILMVDKNLISLVIFNVIENAVKYSNKNGNVNIKLYSIDNNAYIEIEDNGIGIPKEDLEKISTLYYRSSNINKVKGTGIGLFLVTNILKILKGQLKIESNENIGTKVKIILPLN